MLHVCLLVQTINHHINIGTQSALRDAQYETERISCTAIEHQLRERIKEVEKELATKPTHNPDSVLLKQVWEELHCGRESVLHHARSLAAAHLRNVLLVEVGVQTEEMVVEDMEVESEAGIWEPNVADTCCPQPPQSTLQSPLECNLDTDNLFDIPQLHKRRRLHTVGDRARQIEARHMFEVSPSSLP